MAGVASGLTRTLVSFLTLLLLLTASLGRADQAEVRAALDGRVKTLSGEYKVWNKLQNVVSDLKEAKYLTLKYTLSFTQGVTYRFVGACDSDCSALQLEIRDGNGQTLATSAGSSRAPEVEFTPGKSGDYQSYLTLERCRKAEGCGVGVYVLEKKAPQQLTQQLPTQQLRVPSMAGSLKKYEDQVTARLAAVWTKWDDGTWFQRPPLRVTSVIGNGSSVYFTYTFPANTAELPPETTLKIEGVCDEDCGKFSIVVSGKDGQLAESGSTDGGQPNVTLTPRYSGDYGIQLIMSECRRAAGCNVGVDVYQAEAKAEVGAVTPASPRPVTPAPVTPTPASADDPNAQQIAATLQKIYDGWKTQGGGWTLLPELRYLGSGEEFDLNTVSYDLVKGKTYKIVGKCDENCSDLPLSLYDPRGKLVASGTGGLLGTPLDFRAGETGRYELKVLLGSCDDYDCRFGVDIYQAGRVVAAQAPATPAPTPPNPAPPTAPVPTTFYDDQARRALQQRYDLYWKDQPGGWTIQNELRLVAQLAAGAGQETSYRLSGGVAYKILGACEDACTNLDLVVKDAAGQTLASDVALDRIPLLSITPPEDGLYTVTAKMLACGRAGGCSYGLDIYKSTLTAQKAAAPQPAPTPPAPRPGTNLYDEQARTALDDIYDGYWKDQVEGWVTVPAARTVRALRQGAQEDVKVTLTAGVSYQLSGACEKACTNLDLQVRDAAGTVLDTDTDTDEVPILRLTPKTSGPYTVRVSMTACDRKEACSYGLDVYRATALAAAPKPAPTPNPITPTPITPATDAGGNDRRESVLRKLQVAADALRQRSPDLTLLSGQRYLDLIGASSEGGSKLKTYDLVQGQSYRFVVRCENLCILLFAHLQDPAGKQVASGSDGIDPRDLEIRVTQSGRYTLKLDDALCAEDLCNFGVDLYQLGAAKGSADPAASNSAATVSVVYEVARGQAIRRLDTSFEPLMRVYQVRPNSRIILPKLYRVGESVPITLSNFAADQDLLIVAACDDQCTSLTLELRDPGGKLVQNKTDAFGSPFIDFYPHGGKYELTVRMERCANPGGCAGAIEVYKRK